MRAHHLSSSRRSCDAWCAVSDAVDHPSHYGGKDNPYEAIKVIEAWGLGFHLGNVVKYVCRAGRKLDTYEDLLKAQWYLARAIQCCERHGDQYLARSPDHDTASP